MKTKALISFAAKLICVFVFAYAKIRFSHDTAHMSETSSASLVSLSKKVKLLLIAFVAAQAVLCLRAVPGKIIVDL